MKVQYSKENEKPTAKRNKSRRKLKPTFFIFVIILVVGVLAALMLTVLFSVKSFVINGASVYTQEEIMAACGIEIGDNLIRIPTSKSEENIEKTLPYVKEAVVKRDFPSTVEINITAVEEFAQIYSKDGYCIVDTDYKVLKLGSEKRDDLPVIVGIDLTGALEGEAIEFDSADRKKALDTVRTMAKSRELSLTYYDISDYLNIYFEIDKRIYVELGNITNIDRKFDLMTGSINSQPTDIQMKLSLENWTVDNPQCIRTLIEEFAQIQHDSGYYVVDEDYRILKLSATKKSDLPVIKGINTAGCGVGDIILFDDEESTDIIAQLSKKATAAKIKISYYDISDLENICMIIENRAFVEFGSNENINAKFNTMLEAYNSESATTEMKLSLKNWSADDQQCIKSIENISEYIK